jgi:polyphosphate kinase
MDGPEDRAGDSPPPMKNKAYVKQLKELQVELCHLQEWVKATGARCGNGS